MLRRLREAQLGQGQTHHPPPGWTSTLVKRLKLERTLEGHDGCVNTVHFSPDGQLLVSGSDDMQVCFWDWQLGAKSLQFHSGHHNNVFQARIMPQSANSTVVTCAADGLVRVAHVPQGAGGGAVETRRLAAHRGRAHKLSLEPDSPHCFLSCGEDGEVRHFDLREPGAANRRLLACRTQRGRLELNSVHCRPGSTQFCVAGADPFVRVYDLRRVPPASTSAPVAEPVTRLAPWHLVGRGGLVTVTCAVFSQSGRVLATYNDENIYSFMNEQEQLAHEQGTAAAAGRKNGTRSAPSAANREQQAPTSRRPGSRAGAGGSKRGRSGSAGSDSEGDTGPAGRAAAARDRGRRRAAASAALAAAQDRRVASGVSAAAEAHASMRRRLLDAEVEAEAPGVGPQQQPTSQRADAAWLDSLPPPLNSSQPQPRQQGGQIGQPVDEAAGRHEAAGEPQQANGTCGAGSSMQAAAGSPAQRPDNSRGQATAGGGADERGGSGSGGSREGGQDAEEGLGFDDADAPAEVEASADSSGDQDGQGEVEGGSEAEMAEWGQDDDDEGDEGEYGDFFESDEEEEEEEGEEEDPLLQGALVDDADAWEHAGGHARASSPPLGHRDGPVDYVLQTFKGHRNYRTVKGVSYLGQHDEFVMSGSDCGHIYVWDADTGQALAVLKGDHDTVNCLEPHPSHLLTIATSGIEDNIKLWTPTAEEPQVLGAAQRRLMAENERGQGEDRRMFISPHMLRLLLRSRGLLPLSGSSDEGGDDSEEEGGSEGSGARGGSEGGGERRRVRRPDDICTIS